MADKDLIALGAEPDEELKEALAVEKKLMEFLQQDTSTISHLEDTWLELKGLSS